MGELVSDKLKTKFIEDEVKIKKFLDELFNIFDFEVMNLKNYDNKPYNKIKYLLEMYTNYEIMLFNEDSTIMMIIPKSNWFYNNIRFDDKDTINKNIKKIIRKKPEECNFYGKITIDPLVYHFQLSNEYFAYLYTLYKLEG